MTRERHIDITVAVCFAVLTFMGLGAAFDIGIALLHLPWQTWCQDTRDLNTRSNDLLAASMMMADLYVWLQWLTSGEHLNYPMRYQRDSRLLFIACAFLGLLLHLWGLKLLHWGGVEAVR